MTNEIDIRVKQELERILSDPRTAIKIYAQALQDAENEIQQIQSHITQELMPKVEMWDMAMGSDRLEEMSSVAKILNFKDMGRNRLFEYLRDRNVLRSNNEPYQRYVDSGYFKLIEQTVKSGSYTIINNKTMVTQKGLDFIAKLLLGDGYAVNER